MISTVTTAAYAHEVFRLASSQHMYPYCYGYKLVSAVVNYCNPV